MKRSVKVVALGLMSLAGVAVAAEATDPTVRAWQEAMDKGAANAKILGDMAKGETAFDAAQAEAAKAVLVDEAAQIPTLFQTQASDPKSKALPAIWENWTDFEAKAKALGDAAAAMDATTVEGVKAGMGAIGGACGACHEAYRAS